MIEESGLIFNFPNCCQFGGKAPIEKMKNVDFIVEMEHELWFIEVKNINNSRIPPDKQKQEKEKALEKFNNRSLFSNELGPKIRDSYLYYYLSCGKRDKEICYFAILEGYIKNYNEIAIASKELAVAAWFKGPEGRPWPQKYLKSAQVMTVSLWNDYPLTKKFPITRITQLTEN